MKDALAWLSVKKQKTKPTDKQKKHGFLSNSEDRCVFSFIVYLIIGFGKGLFKAIKAKIIPKQEKQLKCIFIQEYIKHRIISHNIDWKIRIPAHTLVHDSIIFLFCIDHDTMK